ncbi:unnamed protein product [Symbiodinium natans]|uniref:Ricin B lectin domain-containing protein n=1 Tax=Symbiodinium natans TaxID=878477 RepID=A0A812KZE5_9DINO|nr:unnamed protein product [Symbiodinium natans]
MWYLSGEHLKSELDNKCLDAHTGNGNLYMYDCHDGNHQKFYFDHGHIRVRHHHRCLEYNVHTGNVFTGTCPDQGNHKWQFEPGVALKKTPLPTQFRHGQSLRASCWSERFATGSHSTETMTCVAGAWANSHNKPGLDGFTCAACIQVVSKVYADLDAQIRQELFFAQGLELQLAVDSRSRRTVTSSGGLRTGGGVDIFVAELMPDASETMRRFRSLTHGGQCLKAAANLRLQGSTCNSKAEPDQLLQAVDLSSLLWDEFKAGANVPGKSHSGLQNRGSAPTTLRSFQLDASCGEHVLESVGFSSNGHLGMSATCTAASTYGAAVEKTLPLPGHIQITSESEGTCMSIHRIVPWHLVVRHGQKCMDYITSDKNVQMYNCHHAHNQMWYTLDGNIISMHDGKCLDYDVGTESRAGREGALKALNQRNVFMHECHDEPNQKWYWDEDTAQIRSEHDHRCLDMALDGSHNIYIHNCHDDNNQKFDSREDRSEVPASAFTMALHLECSVRASYTLNFFFASLHRSCQLDSFMVYSLIEALTGRRWDDDGATTGWRRGDDGVTTARRQGAMARRRTDDGGTTAVAPSPYDGVTTARRRRDDGATTARRRLDDGATAVESENEEITVEPIGGEAKFHLRREPGCFFHKVFPCDGRREPHMLPGEWRWDKDEKIIHAGNGKCLEARGRGRVEEVSCTQRIEQEWAISHGLPGLVDAPMTCPGDQDLETPKDPAI